MYSVKEDNQRIHLLRILKKFHELTISSVKSPTVYAKKQQQQKIQMSVSIEKWTLDHWMLLNACAWVAYYSRWCKLLLFLSLSAKAWCHRRHVDASTNQRQERLDTASKQDWTASNNGWKLKTLCRKICHYISVIIYRIHGRSFFSSKEIYRWSTETNIDLAVAWEEQTVWSPFIQATSLTPERTLNKYSQNRKKRWISRI